MKSLIEISKVVTKRKVKKIEIFDRHYLKNKNNKFNDFFEALTANKFRNDRDAATYLYQSTPTDPKYRQLKSRFKKRLLNTLFFLDINQPSAANYERAYYSCNKDWTLVKILLSNNAQLSAVSLAKQILTTALKYKFADVIVNCSRILRESAASTGDEKSFDLYDEYIKKFAKVLEGEIRSEELFQRVKINYFKLPSKSGDLTEQVDAYCDALVSLSEHYDSPLIYYNMYLVWIFKFEMLRDYKTILEICDQADKYVKKHPDYYHEEKLIMFHTKKMLAYLHLKDYKQGKINAEKCLNSYAEGSKTWFSFMEYYFLLAIHTEQYIQAIAINNQAQSNSKFKKLDGLDKEKWQIYSYFLYYITHYVYNENAVVRKQRKNRFNLNKFLEDPVFYAKDQRIFTILITILKVLFLLEKRNYLIASEHIETLKNYANRQLKKEEYYRPIQFIRLLQQLRKVGFQVDEVKNTKKYLDNLASNPFAYRGALYEMEVIPFEKLWEITLSRLDR